MDLKALMEQLVLLDESIAIQESKMGSFGPFDWANYKKASDALKQMRTQRAAVVAAIGARSPDPGVQPSGNSKYIWWAVGVGVVLGVAVFLLRKKS